MAAVRVLQIEQKDPSSGEWVPLSGGNHPQWIDGCKEATKPEPECPVGEFGQPGWYLCAWNIASNIRVSSSDKDLENIDGLDVCLALPALR